MCKICNHIFILNEAISMSLAICIVLVYTVFQDFVTLHANFCVVTIHMACSLINSTYIRTFM